MRYLLLLTLWVYTDALLFVSGYLVAYFWRVGWIFSTDVRFEQFFITTILTAPWWVLALVTTRVYAKTRHQGSLRNGMYIIFAGIMAAAAFALINYFGFTLVLSRKLLVYAILLTTVPIWLWHTTFAWVMRQLLWHKPVFRALIVGANRESTALIAKLNAHRNLIKPVAILDGRGTKETSIEGVPVKGKLNKLEDVLRDDHITHLIQCADLEQSLNLLSACRQHGITYMLLPSVLGIVERDERVESLEGQPVTLVSPRDRKWGWFFR